MAGPVLRITALVNDQASAGLKRLRGNLSDLDKGFKAQRGGAMGASQALLGVRSASGALTVGAGLAAGAVAAVGAGLAVLASRAGTAAAVTARHRAALVTLTGDAVKAESIFRSLQKFADFSPFDDEAVQAAGGRLLAMGVSAESLIPTLTALADVAGSDAEKFGGLATAFGQMSAKGKVQGEELLQFAERGVPVFALLEEALGVNRAQLDKLLSSGSLLAKDVLPRLVEAIDRKFGGATARAAASTAGLWSTMEAGGNRALTALGAALDPLTRDLATGLTGVFAAITDGIGRAMADPAAREAMAALGEVLRAMLDVLGAIVPILFDAGIAMASFLAPAARMVAAGLRWVANVLRDLARWLKPVWDGLRAVGNLLKDALGWLFPFGREAKRAGGDVGGLGDHLGGLAGPAAVAQAAIAKVVAVLGEVPGAKAVAGAISVVAGPALEAIAAFDAQVRAVPGVVPVVAEADTRDGTVAVEAFLALLRLIPGVVPVMVAIEAVTAVATAALEAFNATVRSVPTAWTTTFGVETVAAGASVEAYVGTLNAIPRSITTVVRTVREDAPAMQAAGGGATGDPYGEAATPRIEPFAPGVIDVAPRIEPYSPGVIEVAPAPAVTLVGRISAALGAWKVALNEGGFGGGALGGFAMAAGGIATRAMPAIIGEAGPEAVIPLARLPEMVGALSGGSVGTVVINVSGFADGASAGRAAADAFRRELGLQRRLVTGGV